MKNQDSATRRPAMTDATRQRLEAQLADPAISDAQNPAFLFSTHPTDLLLAIAGGLVDPVQLAKKELANRGLDADGRWAGFDAAADAWEVER